MPRITIKQLQADIQHLETQKTDLFDECQERARAVNKRQTRLNDLTLKYTSQVQSNLDLRKVNDDLKNRLIRSNKYHNEAIQELSDIKKRVDAQGRDLRYANGAIDFYSAQHREMSTLLYNAFSLLYPYLVARKVDENTDLLEPNDRLLLQLVEILSKGYSDSEHMF